MCALSAFLERMYRMQVTRVLVIGTLRIVQTVWQQEAAKWSHLEHLTFSLIHGTPMQRHRAMRSPARVHLVNYENLVWLTGQLEHHYLSKGKYLPYNMVIYDEISKLKDASTKRHKALRKLLAFLPYRLGLTGTPASNGYIDLFGQYLALDSGARLGLYKTHYQQRYFINKGWGEIQKWELRPGADKEIQLAVSDITLQMSAADYLELPEIVVNDIRVVLPTNKQVEYNRLEKEMFLELDNGAELEVFNNAALINKCLQYANGACYLYTGGPWEEVHTAKLDALEDIVEEMGGRPLLVAFQFRHDVERIQKRFPYAEHFSAKLGTEKAQDMVDRWNKGQIPMLLGHPDSMGHGLNLHHCGDTIAWYGLTWKPEGYGQFNARLTGGLRGVGKRITIHRLLTEDTADHIQRLTLWRKVVDEEALKQALNEYRRGKA